MLGRTLCHRLSGFDIVPASHSSVDIVNSDAVDALVGKVKPDQLCSHDTGRSV